MIVNVRRMIALIIVLLLLLLLLILAAILLLLIVPVTLAVVMIPLILQILVLHQARHKSGILVKIGMLCIDVGQFDGYNVLHHLIGVWQPTSQKLRDDVNNFLVQLWESMLIVRY